jgi:hypothetical protein
MMASKTWILTNAAERRYLDNLRLETRDLAGAPSGARITKYTMQGGLSQGVDEIRVHNGRLEYSLRPTRGMGLWKAWLDGTPIGWQSPVRGPVHPQFVPIAEPSGMGFVHGFDELMCRCGATSNGAPDFDAQGRLAYPLHGLIANRPAHFVSVTVEDDTISVTGVVEETRFHFQKLQLSTTITTRFGQNGFEIHDSLKNISASPGEMQMLYHWNFGLPLLGAGAEVVAPAETIVPRNAWAAEGAGHWSTYSEPKAGMPERVYFLKLYADDTFQTQALLKNHTSEQGVSLRWDVRELPYFSLWKNEIAVDDGYVTGLEPATNFPNPRSFEGSKNRVVRLAPGESYAMRLGLTYHATASEVDDAQSTIRAIQAGRPATLHDQPTPDWCAS